MHGETVKFASTCHQCHPLPCNGSHPTFLGANRCHQRPSFDICNRPPAAHIISNGLWTCLSQKGYFIFRSSSVTSTNVWTVGTMFQSFLLPLYQKVKVSHRSWNTATYTVLQHMWCTSNKMHLHHIIRGRSLQENFSITLNSQSIPLRS
jgi:hypothetical protein